MIASDSLLTDTITANGTVTTATVVNSVIFSGTMSATASGSATSAAKADPTLARFRLCSAVSAICAMAVLFARF